MTTGNVLTMILSLVSTGALGTYVHNVPSTAASEAKGASMQAVAKAEETAAKAAVVEHTVEAHSQELNLVSQNVDQLRIDVATIKSTELRAEKDRQDTNEKLDKMLAAVYRMQGQYSRPSASITP